MRGRNATAALAAACAAVALGGCGGSSVSLTEAGLDLPSAATPAPLASTTVYTSPDGGIYRNPVHLDVLMVGRSDARALEQRLGSAQQWAPLQPLGGFTVVALRLRNTGKAWAEPDVNDLQIASDYAPPQAASGPLHAFYHPTYPLAAVSDTAFAGNCGPHLDPGQSTLVVLVYPPLQVPATGIVWGRYQDFALRLSLGGAVPSLAGRSVSASLCTPPQQAQP